MRNPKIAVTTAILLALVTTHHAQVEYSWSEPNKKRGMITSAPCPFSCADTAIPKELCREYRIGTTCRVEDLSRPPGHQSLLKVPVSAHSRIGFSGNFDGSKSRGGVKTRRAVDGTWVTLPKSKSSTTSALYKRGLVTTASCPYTCASAGLPPSSCREWEIGTTCYVEDRTQPPGHRTLIKK